MSVSIGIDLGTTFSAVAIVDPQTQKPKIIPNCEGNKITPSIIQFRNGEVIFGSEAANAFSEGDVHCAVSFKRNMGTDDVCFAADDKYYNAEELSALLIAHLKSDAERILGEEISDAVITVPAYFYSVEREATLRAARKAGLKVKKIIDEPNAAALAYGMNNWRENANILVYDLGGGTFDVTLVRMVKTGELKTIVTKGDHKLGGKDWEIRLCDLMKEKIIEETGVEYDDLKLIDSSLKGMAEDVKKKLSSMQTVKIDTFVPDFDMISFEINRDEFNSSTADLIERTGLLCDAVLQEAKIRVSDITDILLVGGSTRMPQVSSYLEERYNKAPVRHVNPDEAVALGAAIQATKENQQYTLLSVSNEQGKKVVDRSNFSLRTSGVKAKTTISDLGLMTLTETTAHAMGMIAISKDGSRYINDIIIPANHPRPVKAAKGFLFRTRLRGSNEMEIYVLQGDKENPLDCLIPYRYVVSGIEHRRENKGQAMIKVQYSYDNNGVIHVEARQDDDTSPLELKREPVPDNISKFGLPIDNTVNKPEPLNVILAVDVSGSMDGRPLADAKAAMCEFAEAMDYSHTNIGIIAVADNAVEVCQLTDDVNECVYAINSITCGQAGFGNATHPFRLIKDMFEGKQGRAFSIVLADGVWSGQDEAIESAKGCNANKIETAAIGFGNADEGFLKAISSEDANALFVDQSELSNAFGTIAQSLGGNTPSAGGTMLASLDVETW